MTTEKMVVAPKRRTRAEVQQLVAEFVSSGMRRGELCRSRQLSFSTLDRHLKKRRWKRRRTVYAFRASSEGVVAWYSGTSNFLTVASDSPSSPRSLDAASPNASSTFSLDAAVTCSCASMSPLWQFTAFNPSTYSLPRLAIDPATYPLLPARWQTSRAKSGVSFVLVGRVICCKVSATPLSESILRSAER